MDKWVRMKEITGREIVLSLTISMDDTGPMLLTYMPTSMTVGFSARARGRKGEYIMHM